MTDEEWMQCALDTIVELPSFVAPNPRVGCVIVKDDRLIGQGSTRPPGGNHAEIEALEDAVRKGYDVKGATVYVTLEPCAHQGRTGPCADALIKAGVARVVAAMTDPDPRVSGEGFMRLIAAGVDVYSGVLEAKAREMNVGYCSRILRHRPWMRLKIAASLDGRIALTNGKSQWITSAPARDDAQIWRARADAIITGIGTVINDNPKLTVRNMNINKQPRRIIVDSSLSIDLNANVLAEGNAWIFCAEPNPEKWMQLRDIGIDVIPIPGSDGKVDLMLMLDELAHREINEVHIEAGAVLSGSFIQLRCVDEFLFYLAPSLIGRGQDMFHLPLISEMKNQIQLEFIEVDRVGVDLRILARLKKE